MTRPVTLLFFTQSLECETCMPTRQILDELPPLSDLVTVEEANIVLDRERAEQYGVDRAPSIVVLGRDESGAERDSKIRFVGMPAGYEFASLIRAVLLVGGGASSLSADSLARLEAVDRPVTVRVFTTPTCPHCPRAINLAHEMAFANPNITAFAVEVTEYPDLARQYHVSGVPKTVVEDNGQQVEILGAVPEPAFVEQCLAGFTAPPA
jgi:glutaredoxin-like protein